MAEGLRAIRSLGRWTAPLLTAGVLLLLGLVALVEYQAFRGFNVLDEETRDQRRELADIADLRGLLRAMVDMETGLRGFVITGREEFLQPYRQGQRDFGQVAALLADQWRDDPPRRATLARIVALEADWREAFAEPVLARRRAARTPAENEAIDAELSRGAGKMRTDAVRQLADQLESQMAARVRAAANHIDTRTEEVRAFALRGSFAILLAVGFMAAVIARGFRTAAERNVELAKRVREREEAERRAQASEARFLSFLNGLADAVLVTEDDGRIVWANAALESLCGYPLAELQGAPLARLAGAADAARLPGLIAGLRDKGSPATLELTARRADGHEFPAEIALSRFEAPTGPRLGLLLRDISERKAVERLKSTFIASVSHELRTPLTSIMGYLALLREGEAGTLPAPAQSFVALAHDNCTRLSRLVDDVIDTERIGSGALAFRVARHPLPALLREAVVLNQGYAREHEVFFFLDEPVPAVAVDADRDRLLQAITNLLSNAAKFSPAGEEVHVAGRCSGDRVRVTVTDRGPGIPEAFRPRIFEKFAQADGSDSREKGGTGLGLAIARAIVERSGGTIGFDTETGRGTTFWIEMPVAADLGAPAAAR